VLYLVEQPPYCDLLRLSLRLEGSSALAGQLSNFFHLLGGKDFRPNWGAHSAPLSRLVFSKHKSSAEQAALCTRPAEADVQGLPPKWWDAPCASRLSLAETMEGPILPTTGEARLNFASFTFHFTRTFYNANPIANICYGISIIKSPCKTKLDGARITVGQRPLRR
jgi:hypothetical protein